MATNGVLSKEADSLDIDGWSQPEKDTDLSEDHAYAAMPPAAKKEVHDHFGRVLAGQTAAGLMRRMLAERDLKQTEMKEQFGYAPKVLSQIINDRLNDGPLLSTLMSVADALDYDVEVKLIDRSKV